MTGPEALRAAVIDWERRLRRACAGNQRLYRAVRFCAVNAGDRPHCRILARPGYYVDLEIAGLERNLLRTEKHIDALDSGELTVDDFRSADVYRAEREILVAKQARRRDRLVCLLRRTGRLPAQERRGQRWGRRDRPWSRP